LFRASNSVAVRSRARRGGKIGDAVGEVSRWSGIFAFLDSSAVAPTGDD
jgi:hypothetical protein